MPPLALGCTLPVVLRHTLHYEPGVCRHLGFKGTCDVILYGLTEHFILLEAPNRRPYPVGAATSAGANVHRLSLCFSRR